MSSTANPLTGYIPGSTYWNSQAYANPEAVTTAPRDLSRTAAWANTFGQPQGDAVTRRTPDEGVNRGVWIFPEAKRGQSRELQNTMMLVLRSLNDAILNIWLPMTTPTDGALQSHWSRWEFPTQMPDVVPHRGVVRLLKSNRIQGTTSMVRRGIGMFMEHDFMKTELGKKHYMMHLKQINQSVAEGLQFNGIYAMLNSDNWGRKYLMDNGDLASSTRMERIMEREIDRWAILQQNPNSWAFLDNIITKENNMYNPGTKLNHYLVDSAVSAYLTTIPTEQWQYFMKGPAGPELIRQGVEGFAVDTRGNRITETRAFLADEEGAITPLAQKTQIGEVFIAYDHYMDGGSYKGYTSGDRDVDYYDESADVMARLKLREMLDNCCRFDENGELYDFNDRRAMHFNISRISEQHKDADFLHYRNSRGERVKVRYFGQIDPYHMSVEDYRDAGRSAINSLKTRCFDDCELDKAFRPLRNLLNISANYSNAAEINRFIKTAITPAAGWGNESIRHPILGEIMVGATNSYGSAAFRAKAGGAADLTSMAYPFTHMTWGGLRTVATDPNAAGWFGQSTVAIAQEAVRVIERLVPELIAMYPGCIFLDPVYASPSIKNPTPYDAFFGSVLMAGIVTTSSVGPYRRAGEAGGDPASSASTVIGQLEDMIVGGLSSYVDSIGGITTTVAGKRAGAGAVLIAANPALAVDGTGDNVLFYNKKNTQSGLNLATGRRQRGEFGTIADAVTAAEDAAVGVENDRAAEPLKTNYTNFVRFTQMVRTTEADVATATSEAGLNRLVAGLLGRALILNIITFTKTTGDAATTLDRFNEIFKAMKDAVPGLASAYDSADDYKWISAGTAFSDSRNLERMVRQVIELFTAHPDWVSFEVGDVRALNGLLAHIVSTFDEKKKTVARSLSRAPAAARGGAAPANLQRLAAFEKAITERKANYVSLPMTWTNTSIKAFVDGLIDDTIKTTDLFLIPASTEDPRVAMSMAQFVESNSRAAELLPLGTLSQAAGSVAADAGLIASGIDSIHLPNIHTRQIASSIEHNASMRVATMGARAQNPSLKQGSVQVSVESDESSRIIGAAFKSTGYAERYGQSKTADRSAADRANQGLPMARRNKRSLLQDSVYGNEAASLDDARENRKRARIEQSLQSQGFSTVNLLSEKINPSMRSLYGQLMLRGLDDMTSVFGTLFLGTPVTKRALEATIEYDLMHPFNYVCARAHARYTGLTVIKGAPDGGKIGMTMVLYPKTEVADDGTTGVQHINFTYYSDSIVVNSKMLNITHNAMIDAYHGGLGSGFYTRETYNPSDDEYGDGSFHIFAIPRRERPEGKYISISGTYDWADGRGNVMRSGSRDALTYSTAAFYCGYWGFHQTNYNRPMDLTTSSKKYTTEYCAPNNLCVKSTAIYFKGGKPTFYTTQQGHWQQQSVGPSLARARIGKKPLDNSAYKSVIANLRQITQ